MNRAAGGPSSTIPLATFDGAKGSTSRTWQEKNDPVMGGKSTGTFKVSSGVGVFDGEVVNVPFLKAPGFITTSVTDSKGFPDVSQCAGVSLTVRTNTAYDGYRFSFGTAKPPGGKFFAYGYKSHFTVTPGS